METKKSPEANLERKRILFLEIGFVMALGICLAAFEWSDEKVPETAYENLTKVQNIDAEIINTFVEPPPPPPARVIPVNLIIRSGDFAADTTVVLFPGEIDYAETVNYVFAESEIPDETEEILNIGLVDKKPTFPGGETELFRFISENTEYPQIAKDNFIQGKVYVRFVIGIDGKISNLSVVKGVDKYLDQEALRVISLLPDWTPGAKDGKLVPVSYIIPISFILR